MFIRRPSDIGLMVKAQRKARGLSQEDLAARLGVSRLWVNEFEGGKPTVRLDLALRVLSELGITLRAQTDAKVNAAIDIDDIADMGLQPAPAAEPSRSPTRRRRRG